MERKEVKLIADNKKAFFDYFIEDKYEAGIVLCGCEVKSIRAGKVNLKDSYVVVKNNEVFLIGAHIAEYEKADGLIKIDTRRTRKLLLSRSEITKLERKVKIKGFTLVPTKMYFSKNLVKVEIGVARGKELHNKKQSLKEQDIKREMDKELKMRFR